MSRKQVRIKCNNCPSHTWTVFGLLDHKLKLNQLYTEIGPAWTCSHIYIFSTTKWIKSFLGYTFAALASSLLLLGLVFCHSLCWLFLTPLSNTSAVLSDVFHALLPLLYAFKILWCSWQETDATVFIYLQRKKKPKQNQVLCVLRWGLHA